MSLVRERTSVTQGMTNLIRLGGAPGSEIEANLIVNYQPRPWLFENSYLAVIDGNSLKGET